MELRYMADAVRFETMTTAQLRQSFLVETLFKPGEINLLYADVDRAIAGSAVPTGQPLSLTASKELASDYFCQRRELGVINIGGKGAVLVDGTEYPMGNRDGLYVGRGSRDIRFVSAAAADPAMFYLLSYPAHAQFPTTPVRKVDAVAVSLGSVEQCNQRTIYKYIHPDGIKSCQLVMGFTELAAGSVWNTMPTHTHERRSEVYLYFDIADDSLVFHLMGRPDNTRHLVVRNRQAVISPSWSIHSGVGTRNYTFIWGMGGENQRFDDMDWVHVNVMK